MRLRRDTPGPPPDPGGRGATRRTLERRRRLFPEAAQLYPALKAFHAAQREHPAQPMPPREPESDSAA